MKIRSQIKLEITLRYLNYIGCNGHIIMTQSLQARF